MDQRQVDIVGTKLRKLSSGWRSACSSAVFNPDLGGDEQLITRDATFSNGLTYSRFVIIDLCGINGAIAQLQRRFLSRSDYHIIFQAEGAKTKCRDCHDFPLYLSISVNEDNYGE